MDRGNFITCRINAVGNKLVVVVIFSGFASNPNVPTMIVGATLIIATLISTIIADVAGRRVLLLISGSAMTASIATLGAYFYITEQHQVICSASQWSRGKKGNVVYSSLHMPHCYGNSHTIWDHTVLPATRKR